MLYFPYIAFFSCNDGLYCGANGTQVYGFDGSNYLDAIMENLQLQQQPVFEVETNFDTVEGPSAASLSQARLKHNLHHQLPFLYGYFRRIDPSEQR